MERSDPSHGAGEGSLPPTSAALANAFAHATGRRLRELPVTPTPPTGDQPALAWGDVPSPDDAQCRAREGAVLCHGPGYSPPDSPGLPVAVRFDPGPPIAESAVVMVGRSTSWGPECLVERGCSRALVPIPRCGWLASARPWSEILPDASSLSGQVVHVRGVLGVALGFNTMMGNGGETLWIPMKF